MRFDTKRLRELSGLSLWYSDEGEELQTLILAACDELERLEAIVSRPSSKHCNMAECAKERAELRTENEQLRDNFLKLRQEVRGDS